MMGYALVTGATSGMGLELALNFARDQINLILVSENQQALERIQEKIKKEYRVDVEIISKDMIDDTAVLEIYTEVKKRNLHVDYLINCAGFGAFGRFKEIPVQREKDLVKLNVLSLLEMNKRFVPDMVKRQFGYILNVASLSSFLPGPLMANYYATKANVLSLTEAMHEELKEERIIVTALCPGPVNTNFQKVAKLKQSKNMDTYMMEAKQVADLGYGGLWRGKAVVVPGWKIKFVPFLVRLMPRALARKVSMSFQSE